MRYSLLSRFRGALLGSLLGEMFSSPCNHAYGSRFLLGCQFKDNNTVAPSLITNQSNWSRITTSGTNSLIKHGRLELEDWQLDASEVELGKNTDNSSEAALATLPIALFFHDDQSKLQQQLLAVAASWHQTEAEAISAVGYAICFAITETVNPGNLIPQILTCLGTKTAVGQQLQQVQSLIDSSAPLETAVNQLRPASCIALAFYCFLSTPEDFRLSISRTRYVSNKFPLVAALTGAISGAYNSNVGIPVSWRLAANKINLSSERLQLAERLFAMWSGVYDISAIEPFNWAAIAAPRVIGSRS